MTYSKTLEHNQILRSTRAYCAYCRKNKNWKPKHQGRARAFGTDITNIRDGSRGGSGGQFRGSRTQWGCVKCNVALYKVEDCWRLWHKNLN